MAAWGEAGAIGADRDSAAGMPPAPVVVGAPGLGHVARPRDEVPPAGRAVEDPGQQVPGVGELGLGHPALPVDLGDGLPPPPDPLP